MTTNKSTLTRVLAELAEAFETSTRPSGEAFVRMKEGAPAWIGEREPVRAAHEAIGGRLPDDWTYEACRAVAESLAEYDDPDDDDAAEVADALVDVYTAKLSAWLADHIDNAALCDEAAEEYGEPDADKGITGRISLGQYLAYRRIADAILSACREEAEEREDADVADLTEWRRNSETADD